MYRRGYRPCNVQRQSNAERYDTAISTTDKYRKHIDPNYVDQDGRNAIHLAVLAALRDACNDGCDTAETPSLTTMDQAVQAGCDVNVIDRWGRQPIHYAAEAGHLGCLKRLVRYGADPNAWTGASALDKPLDPPGFSNKGISDLSGLSPLMVAARRGKTEAMVFLLKNGAKASLANDFGESALHYAACCTLRPEECIAVLLGLQPSTVNVGNGKSPSNQTLLNAQDSAGLTPLMAAIRNKSTAAAISAVSYLINLGADPSRKDSDGRTALHFAAQKNIPEIIHLLASTTAIDLDDTDKQGHTAYVTAIMHDSPGALQALIDVGCDRNSIDGLTGTALGLAALKGHAKVIETLVRNGEDPDEFAQFGKTPLMLAAFEAQELAVDALLRLGADPNLVSRSGGTSLHAALMRVNTDNEVKRHAILVNLIRYGGDVNRHARAETATTSGKHLFQKACSSTTGRDLPLSYAIDSGYVSLVRILVAAGARLSHGELQERQASDSQFFDTSELLAPVLDASCRPVPLLQACRAVIRKAIFRQHRRGSQYHIDGAPSRRIEDLFESLPVASRLRQFLLCEELNAIPVHRARILDGAQLSMAHTPKTTPCGLSAAAGLLNTQQLPGRQGQF